VPNAPEAIDAHIHLFPLAYYEFLAARGTEPRMEFADGRWSYLNGRRSIRSESPEWHDLDTQFETAAKTGYDMALISSGGVHGDLDGLPASEAKEGARIINEDWAAMQRKHPGRFYGAAVVPLMDVNAAIDELDYAIDTLGLLNAVSLPSSIAGEGLDAPRLEPFWAHVEKRGVTMFLHPVDSALLEAMDGYNYRLHASMGRVCDSSMAVMRLILSGTLDRHPALRILHFHAGGVLPYVSGRLDKNASIPGIERQPTEYIKEMWTDTAQPYAPTIQLAMGFYGDDRVMYGSDNPCWNPTGALRAVEELELTDEVRRRVMFETVSQVVDIPVPVLAD
jgi:aminocarboxymuconate-semialdehyde decarboxylase